MFFLIVLGIGGLHTLLILGTVLCPIVAVLDEIAPVVGVQAGLGKGADGGDDAKDAEDDDGS